MVKALTTTTTQREAILAAWRARLPAQKRVQPKDRRSVLVAWRSKLSEQQACRRRTLTPYQRQLVASSQKWCCNACGTLFRALWHVDHVVPLADGGPDELGNMQALCADCHADKTSDENARRPPRHISAK